MVDRGFLQSSYQSLSSKACGVMNGAEEIHVIHDVKCKVMTGGKEAQKLIFEALNVLTNVSLERMLVVYG